MAEILTESFCERCGSRYTFESTTGRRRGLGRIRTRSRGVKNFVANDDATFTDAMALAREEDARNASLQQLDAFHRTFNFCMTCRQYTCRNCWNSAAGECHTCAPDLSLEVLPAAFPDLALVGPEAVVASPEAPAPNVAASAWPSSDVRAVAAIPSDTDALAAEAEAEAARQLAAEQAAEAEAEAARQLAAEQAAEAEAEIELTPTELATIKGALHRRIAAVDRSATIGAAPASPRQAPDGIETVAETPDAAITPAPSEAVSTSQLEPVTAAQAETRRFFQWFRVRRSRRELPAPSVPVASLDDTTAITPIEPAGTLLAEPKAPPPEAIEVEVAAMTPEPEPTPLAVESADMAEAALEPELEPVAAAAPEPEPVAVDVAAHEPIDVAAAATGSSSGS